MSEYTASQITVKKGLDGIRARPGMYIGRTDIHGLHHLLWEVIDNSVDEAINGHATLIEVTLHRDGTSCSVSDNGRGIPADIHPEAGKPALELVFTNLHGLHHLRWEVIDNSVDEAINGHATFSEVTLHSDGTSCSVRDDVRGIPVDIHPEVVEPALDLVFTILHVVGLFGSGSYMR